MIQSPAAVYADLIVPAKTGEFWPGPKNSPMGFPRCTVGARHPHRDHCPQSSRVAVVGGSREANAPQTRLMLASMLNNRAESIARLIDHALDAIDDAF